MQDQTQKTITEKILINKVLEKVLISNEFKKGLKIISKIKFIMPSLGGRILGILLYMIPWSDSIMFGNHLYIKYPFVQIIQIPAIPIIIIERSIPFGSLLLFLAIFLGLVRNSKVSYFLRFNALQSLLINIGIIILSFIFD